MGGDGAWAAAVVEDTGCVGEREGGVDAFDEDFDGDGAGDGGELLVLGGEGGPVVAFGCWESLVSTSMLSLVLL